MARTHNDYSTFATDTITIKNLKVATDGKVDLWNTGLKAADELADPAKPAILEGELVSKPEILRDCIEVRFFRSNGFVVLAPEEEITITAKSSEEMAYYDSLNSDVLSVVFSSDEA